MSDYSSILALLEKHAPKYVSPKLKVDPNEIRVATWKNRVRPLGQGAEYPEGLVRNLYALYQSVGTLEKTAEIVGTNATGISRLFKRRKLAIKDKVECPSIIYKGMKFAFRKTKGGACYYVSTQKKTRHMTLHRVMWEEKNGPLPEGYVIIALNGNATDLRPDNFKCVTRGESAARARNIHYGRAA